MSSTQSPDPQNDLRHRFLDSDIFSIFINWKFLCIACLVAAIAIAYRYHVNQQVSPQTEKTTMSNADWENAKSVYDFTVNTIDGEPVSLEKYKGHVLLIVNVASRCGLTSSNYAQLVELDEKYRDKGLRILAFPCNQFGKQEPGSAEQICAYTKKKNVQFDIFDKIDVNGENAHPLYKYLKRKQPGTLGDFIKWNFSKFIVNKDGQPVERHAPTAKPLSLIPNIEKYL